MKKKLVSGIGIAALIVALSACGGTNGSETSGATTEPEQIFSQRCASCHGGDLSGGYGPNLEKIGADKTKDEILSIIHNGQGAMAGGLIKGEQAEAVAEWLSTKK